MLNNIYLWADILWLPIVFFLVHKQHRWWAMGFVIGSMIMMRLQVEIMGYGGYENGIMGVWGIGVHARGLIVYSTFYIIFLLLAHFSPNTKGVVFMAACLGLFFMAFFSSMILMIF
tara:strand:- start:31 stop:378 length:348 start_codon:yes stop_codon:yes gene_type:complete